MKAVIFDLDGTLIDSAPDIHAAVNLTLAEIGAARIDLRQVKSFIGNGVGVLIEKVRAARGLTLPQPEVLERFMQHYNANPATLTTLYPNVRATLELLTAQGTALGVCTNKPEGPTREILAAFDLTRFFSAVVGGDTLTARKPDPAPLAYAVAALNRPTTAYVGDSEVDAETAQRAALPFAIFSQGYRKTPISELPHDASFDDFAELPAVLDRLMPVPA